MHSRALAEGKLMWMEVCSHVNYRNRKCDSGVATDGHFSALLVRLDTSLPQAFNFLLPALSNLINANE